MVMSIMNKPYLSFLVQCRDVDQAERIFCTIKQKTVFMYGALFKGRYSFVDGYSQQLLLIVGYIINGMPEKVLQMFDRMSVQSNEVIATILFNACAKVADPHAMNVGRHVLNQLPPDSIEDHILMNSATDMLMKFGEVHQAEQLFRKIKRKNSIVYGAMMQGHTQGILSCNQMHLYFFI
jgi:pentatricopeptide repeat protein